MHAVIAVSSGPPLESLATLAAQVFNAASTAELPPVLPVLALLLSVVVDAAQAAAEHPTRHAIPRDSNIFFFIDHFS
ncbi:hypothetical protein [Variovorax sp. OV084]|jgi:hypothetical protein|uniref:hypothetical protein n=1 Tax=Variovorax sp. OV084 TaxID=1882777 RepID=UPI00115FC299|nr:hypothetical protein [Variovorax sp. OV084]